MINKQNLINVVGSAALVSTLSLGITVNAQETTLNGPLVLKDFGSFFVNEEIKETRYAGAGDASAEPQEITVNQMYVQYMVPAKNGRMWPLIMMHGGTHSGKTYETTPDDREGWFTYFTRQGIPSYVTDAPGRGRSGFDRSVINEARVEMDLSLLPGIGVSSNTVAWTSFRIGPSLGVPWPNGQFPVEAADQYFAQLNPSAETTLEGGEAVNTPNALEALLDRIGPAILMVHSRSGPLGLEVAIRRPELVKAVIAVEPISCAVSDDDISAVFVDTPYLVVHGDNVEGTFWASIVASCQETVDSITAAGGTAFNLHLPVAGIEGNSHMLMLDRNNLEIADVILEWMRTHIERPHPGRGQGLGR